MSQKKRHPFHVCDNLVGYHPILPILGRNCETYPSEFEANILLLIQRQI